jgi:hypothetical protein
MYDTVDQAHGPLPRTLAGTIQDPRRPVCGHLYADSPAWTARNVSRQFQNLFI